MVLLAGCTPYRFGWSNPTWVKEARQTLSARPARLTQRAVVKAAGREFSCDGVVQFDADGGLELAVLSPMGVMAEVRMDSNGVVQVVKTAPSFRKAWAQEYIGTVVKLLFPVKVEEMATSMTVLWRREEDGRRWEYVFDGRKWQEATIRRGGRRVWEAKGSPEFWRVKGPGVEIELRTVERK